MIRSKDTHGTFYEEKAPYSRTIKIILTLGFAILVLSYAFLHSPGFEKAPEDKQFILLLVVLIYSLAMWSFFNMRFRISDSSVEAVMPPFKYRVLFSEIKYVKTIDKIPWYIGWGMRLWGRGLAFVSKHKKAVVIGKDTGFFRRFIMTAQDPDEFVMILKKKMG